MKENHLLTRDQIERIRLNFEVLTFPNDFDLIQKKHILPGVIILLNGELHFMKKTIEKIIDEPGSLIGWNIFENNKKSKYLVRIKAGTEIILVGRSHLKNLKELLPGHDTSSNLTVKERHSPEKS